MTAVTAARLRVNLALATLSAAVALVSADLLLSPWTHPRNQRLYVIEELGRRGIRAVPPVSPYLFVAEQRLERGLPRSIDVDGAPLLPLGGISRRTTVDCKEAGEWLIYDSDEHGFQNPAGLWDGSAVDVVAVGDSFTKGECVAPDANMVARIRGRYPSTLNLAQPGNGPLAMLATLREYLPHLRPRVVLWCYFAGNDLGDLRFEREHAILSRYLEGGFRQGLLEKQSAIDQALEASVETAFAGAWRRRMGPGRIAADALLLRNLRARAAAWLLGVEPQLRDFATSEESYALFEAILRQARVEAVEAGGRLHFVYLPAWVELFGDGRSRELAARRRERVVAIVHELELPFIDVLDEFASVGRRELFICPACHYSAEGYDRAARRVLAALESEDRRRR